MDYFKNTIFPPKSDEKMSEQDWFEFRNTIDPDLMGFNDEEEYITDDFTCEPAPAFASIANTPYTIKDNLTSLNFSNGSSTSRIKYIVVHYTANNGDTAWGNSNYFKSTYRGASAHYFVDEGNIIWRIVRDKDISWHCGGGLQGSSGHSFYKIATNSNSIGIEMCSRKNNNGYYFKEQTITNCINLVKYLMKKYNVPIKNVIRHYDVTGKTCPAPYVSDSAWSAFKSRLVNSNVEETKIGVYKVVNCDELNVRTGNGTHYEKIGTLKVNSEITITEINNGWGKIKYNNNIAWVCLDYLEFVSKISIHWAQEYLDKLIAKKYITDESQWNEFDKPLRKDLAVALLDNISGGTWRSNEANSRIHWAHPNVISLCGKGIITDPIQWTNTLEHNLSKALLLALIDKLTNGTLAPYATRFDIDHWGRNCLDSLCDKAIVTTPNAWTDFDSDVTVGAAIALICKAIYK